MRRAARDFFATYEPRCHDDAERWPSAVMLLLYERDGEEHLLFQVRTQHVEHHKGEVSLPGGGRDPGDESHLHTALRETHEEIGVAPEHIEVFGQLDDQPTRSNFLITPFAGAITEPAPYPFRSAAIEVAELLEVPVSHLLSPDSLEWIVNPYGVRMQAYRYGDHLIYGATAMIVRRFLDLLTAAIEGRPAPEPPPLPTMPRAS